MKNNPIDTLKDKKILVTGSLKRLGREIVLSLASEGAIIAGHYRSGSGYELAQLENKVIELGGKVTFYRAELDKESQCLSLMERVYGDLGTLDMVVNSASIFPKGTVGDMTYSSLEENLKINSWAPFIISRLFYEKSGRGAIVNLIDTKVKDYDLNHVPYYLSKRMLADMTQLTALEFSPKVRVNGIAPGLILPPDGEDKSYLEELKSGLPLKSYGDKSQISDAVVFLLKNNFITGQVIYVDGGAHLKGGF